MAKHTTKRTPAPWTVACDSYGKVQHSRKACVFAKVTDERGYESLPHVASRIDNWDDAKLIAAAPDLLAALKDAILWVNSDDQGAPEMIAKWRAVIAQAEG